jgi:hypothetical protein
MGYSTDFTGELRFTKEATVGQLAELNRMFGEDCRDHPEWKADGLYYVDLELSEDFGGIKWNGAEKTYQLDKIVNVVIAQMRKTWPDFGLTGQMLAQGEDAADRWALVIGDDGFAEAKQIVITGKRVECPSCGKHFIVEEAAQ